MNNITPQYKPLYPWLGGLNTSQDAIILDAQDLTIADNIVFTTSGSRKKRGGQDHYNSTQIPNATAAENVVYFTNYWAVVSNAKREYFVALTDSGNAYHSQADSGTWTSFSTLTLTVAHGGVTSSVMNEKLIIGLQGSGVPKIWDQSTSTNLVDLTSATTSALPFTDAWITRFFLERMCYAGDPAFPDRVYFSAVGTYNDFDTGGAGSGITIEVGIGDGDPSGITAIFPGTGADKQLYVAKRNHLYRIDCSDLDQSNWQVIPLSNQVGCVNPNAVVTVDQSDVVFMSDRGVHTLSQVINATTVLEGEFISFPIQPDYQRVIASANRAAISCVWSPALNSFLFSCKRLGKLTYETVYGYNFQLGKWFRWTSVPCNFLFSRLNTTSGNYELYAAAPDGYVNELNQTTLNDFGDPIVADIQSAFIFPEGIPFAEYSFTRLAFIFRSHEDSTFRVYYTIDGLTSNSFDVAQKIGGGNILGTTLLGPAFFLGNVQGVKPFFQHITGVGSSIQIRIQQDGLNEDLELFGLVLEFQGAGERQFPFNSPVFA